MHLRFLPGSRICTRQTSRWSHRLPSHPPLPRSAKPRADCSSQHSTSTSWPSPIAIGYHANKKKKHLWKIIMVINYMDGNVCFAGICVFFLFQGYSQIVHTTLDGQNMLVRLSKWHLRHPTLPEQPRIHSSSCIEVFSLSAKQ